MIDITLSQLELEYIKETLTLCLEEMDGIEDSGCDYVCLTGAKEEAESVVELINNWLTTVNCPEDDLE